MVLARVVAGEGRGVLVQYIKRTEDNKSECTLCGQSNALRSNVLNHVESVHFPGSFLYTCVTSSSPPITPGMSMCPGTTRRGIGNTWPPKIDLF